MGTYLQNDQWVVVVRFSLGEAVYPLDMQCPTCQQPDSFFCRNGGKMISCHSALQEGLIRLAQSAGLNPVKEARFLLHGLDLRSADLLIPFPGTNG